MQTLSPSAPLSRQFSKSRDTKYPLIISYDSLEQVIDLLRKAGEQIHVLSHLGPTSPGTIDYLKSFVPCQFYSVGAIPQVVPFGKFMDKLESNVKADRCHADPDFPKAVHQSVHPTLYDVSVFSRQKLLVKNESWRSVQSQYRDLIKPLSADHDGSRIGFFDQVLYTLVGVASVALTASVVGGYYAFRYFKG